MNKTQYYLSQCAEAASKSSMCFTLGAVMVKGGKVISSGYNHHRPHYDGAEVRTHGHRKPVSMHAEMHAIFSLTGMSPSFKTQVQGMERRGQKGQRALRDTSRGPVTPPPPSGTTSALSPPPSSGSSKRPKGKSRRSRRSSCRSRSSSVCSGCRSYSDGESVSGESRPSISHGRSHSLGPASHCDTSWNTNMNTATRLKDGDRGWDARRRDPRANGADLYVARFTKNGMGSAKPCWRCLEWCRWAGVKRIFHWDADEGRFLVVKVNDAQSAQYETHADIRLFAGLGW
ncbi:hypothetical protein K466DRAFT_516324 [Polyporus arcularius HHB13444]|uniref:CMP/dCMP-type deaminase domain-containing protein n=1 Tax=Polyporus arcularius HHB13444 TaxID=1314778 RepID=A0A5C3PMG7_9APHY|nr:hypothetical protein K466DRAFT_516324 [Polyporus arcularius HHB13444]